MTPFEVLQQQRRCSSGFTWKGYPQSQPAVRPTVTVPVTKIEPVSDDGEFPEHPLQRTVYAYLTRLAVQNAPLPTAKQMKTTLKLAVAVPTIDSALAALHQSGFVRVLKRSGSGRRLAVELRTGAVLQVPDLKSY